MRKRALLLSVVVLQSGCAVGAPGIDQSDADTLPITAQPADRDAAQGIPADSDWARDSSTMHASDAAREQPDGDSAVPSGSDTDASTTPMTPPVGGPSGTPIGMTCGTAICDDDVSRSGKSCTDAITLGRGTLLNSSPEYVGSTESSGSNQDLAIAGCEDEGNDVFYRIYLYAGEVLNLSVRNRTTGADPTIKFYFSSDCGATPSGVVCIDKGGKNISELIYEQPALGEGWHYIVIDGPAGAGGKFSISKVAPLATVTGACSC